MSNACFPETARNAAVLYNRLGAGALRRGACREASFYLLGAVACDPEFWPAFFKLGNAWAGLGEEEAAIWAYEQAVRHCDHHAPLFLNLGILLCRRGRHKEALPYLEHAWRLAPEEAPGAAALGYTWFCLGEYALAWHWYGKAGSFVRGNRRIPESPEPAAARNSLPWDQY